MTNKQRALYFAGVCASIGMLGVLLLAYAAHAAGPTQYTSWIYTHSGGSNNSISPDLDQAGCEAAWSAYESTSGTYYFTMYDPSNTATAYSFNYGYTNVNGSHGYPAVCAYSAFGGGTHGENMPYNAVNMNNSYLPTTGDYTMVIKVGSAPTSVTDGFMEYKWHWDTSTQHATSIAPTPPPPAATFITLTQPTQGTTTPTTTLDIAANYGIGNDLTNFSLDGSLPTKIGINLTLQSVNTGAQIDLGTDYSIPSSVGTYTYATTTVQAQGDYTLIATLVGVYGTYVPPPANCTPFPPFTTCTGTTESHATLATSLPPPTFSLANGTFPLLGFQVGNTASRNGLATTTCSITAIGGCFQNALAFLFYPSPDSLNQFADLWQSVENKPPFGYVSQTISSLSTLNASSTPTFSLGNIPLMDVLFTPIRTGLGALLWVGFFIAFYFGRLKHLDI